MSISNTIETFDGTPARRSSCRKIKGLYYEMNRQCFLMNDDKWHRIDNGLIVFNHTKGNYILKKEAENLIEGVIGMDDMNKVVYGYFESNLDSVQLYVDKHLNIKTCINEDVASKIGKERISTGDYYCDSALKYLEEIKGKDINRFLNEKSNRKGYNFRVNYNSTHKLQDFKETSDKYFKSNKSFPYAKHLGKATFGLEFETSNGNIPENKLLKTGFIACRDGSVAGHEYVTIPLQGERGLAMLDESVSLLQKYTKMDSSCSVHCHIGTYDLSKEYAVSVYRLLYQLQEEVYEMFPKYYRETSKFKQRDYNNPLPALTFSGNAKKNFDKIYYYLLGMDNGSARDYPFQGFGAVEHPLDNQGQHKWHIPTRYHLYNLVPMIWGNRGTVEARIHTPTMNKAKVGSWLFLNNAILKVAFENRDEISSMKMNISSLTLADVISLAYDDVDLVDYLQGYIIERKADMAKQNTKEAGRVGKTEVKEDMNFRYSTNKISSLLCD